VKGGDCLGGWTTTEKTIENIVYPGGAGSGGGREPRVRVDEVKPVCAYASEVSSLSARKVGGRHH